MRASSPKLVAIAAPRARVSPFEDPSRATELGRALNRALQEPAPRPT